jgi:hypothetical protein
MTTQIYRKLNLLDYSPEKLDIVREYVKSGKIPTDYTEKKKERFIEHYKDFKLIGNDLIYTPLNLRVILDQDREALLQEIYNDPLTGIGLGIQSFYNKVNANYLNVRRKDVQEFLTRQTVYQLNKPEQKPINKPIVGKYPNNRWAIDLIDMTKFEGYNNGYKWILTGIDYFSKYVFATPLKNKEDDSCLEGLEKIIHEQMEDTYPHLLQSDNGKEFKNEIFKEWAEEHDVSLINTLSYTPTGNALVENFNKFLRKMINEGMIRYNSFNWVDHLDEYLTNRNDMRHGVTKKAPVHIWVPGRNKKAFKKNKDVQAIRKKLVEKAKKDIKLSKVNEYSKGDYVRASMTSLYSEQRKIEKAGHGKLLPVKFSPEIYIVEQVINPKKNKDFAHPEYILKTMNGTIVNTEEKLTDKEGLVREARRFFATDLQHVAKEQEKVISQHQGVVLNRLGVDAYNQEELEEIEKKKEQAKEKAKTKRIQNKEQEEKEKEEFINNPRRSGRSNKGKNEKVFVDFEM